MSGVLESVTNWLTHVTRAVYEKDVPVTKENLLNYFKTIAHRNDLHLHQVLGPVLSKWREQFLKGLQPAQLITTIHEMRRLGVQSYEERGDEGLFDDIWIEFIVPENPTSMCQLIEDYEWMLDESNFTDRPPRKPQAKRWT